MKNDRKIKYEVGQVEQTAEQQLKMAWEPQGIPQCFAPSLQHDYSRVWVVVWRAFESQQKQHPPTSAKNQSLRPS